jgi:hypothetical protein
MTTTENKMQVANTIAHQIGALAFMMMGTMNKLGAANSLIFNLRGSPKRIDKIVVTLEPSDTYRVDFYRGAIARHPAKLEASVDGVYADGLKQCIEHHTGLELSL